jgi:choline kinase
MIGLVLAAGAGRRLRPYTDTLPKALIAVDGEHSVLDLTLRNFAAVELTDAAVIVGYAADQVRARKDELERRYGVTLHLVDNDKALEWNNAYSLWCARDFLTEGVLLANGDTVHPVAVEEILLANRGPDVLLAVDTVKSLAEEEMKVYGDGADSSRLAAINKALDPAKAAGEYIGLTLIEPGAAAPLIDALRATWERDPQLYYEDGYQELVDRGARVDLQPIGEVSWVEIDNHDDLARAREIACRY